MGEELSGLSVHDLQKLENQLEIGLRGIRMNKVKDLTFHTILNYQFISTTKPLIFYFRTKFWQMKFRN